MDDRFSEDRLLGRLLASGVTLPSSVVTYGMTTGNPVTKSVQSKDARRTQARVRSLHDGGMDVVFLMRLDSSARRDDAGLLHDDPADLIRVFPHHTGEPIELSPTRHPTGVVLPVAAISQHLVERALLQLGGTGAPDALAHALWPIVVDSLVRGNAVAMSELAAMTSVNEVTLAPAVALVREFVEAELGTPGALAVTDELTRGPIGLQSEHATVLASLPNPFEYAMAGGSAEELARTLLTNGGASRVSTVVPVRGAAQMIFRRALLAAYDSRCAFCGTGLIAEGSPRFVA